MASECSNGKPLKIYLTECDIGSKLTVLRVNSSLRSKQRLSQLGINPGVKIIKKKTAPWKGPIEVIAKGASLVIGRGLAAKIMVCYE